MTPDSNEKQQQVELKVGPLNNWRCCVDQYLSKNKMIVCLVLLMICFVIFLAPGGNRSGGDTRATADISWTAWHLGEFYLNHHPNYQDEGPRYGYWAIKTDNGLITSIYPLGTTIYGAMGYGVMDLLRVNVSVAYLHSYVRFIAAGMLSIAAVCLWLVLIRLYSPLAGLISVLLFCFGTLCFGCLSQALHTHTGALLSQSMAILCIYPLLGERANKFTIFHQVLFVFCGLFSAWSIFCRPTFAAWVGLFGLYFLTKAPKKVWLPAIGLVCGVALGALLNYHSTGDVMGLYISKQSGEVGFSWELKRLFTVTPALLVSPYRGILLFSPWLFLAVAGGVMVFLQYRKRDYFLFHHLVFCLVILISLTGFNQWHGGWSPGPRLQSDLLISATILATPVIVFLLDRYWGILLLCVLAIPSLYINGKIAYTPDNHIELYYVKPDQPMNDTWNWNKSTLKWYLTDGDNLSALRKTARPVMTANSFTATEKSSVRFIKSAMLLNLEKKIFEPKHRKCVFQFVPPDSLFQQGEDMVMLIIVRGSWRDNYCDQLEFVLNDTQVARYPYIRKKKDNVHGFRIKSSMLEKGEVNTLTFYNHSPLIDNFGSNYVQIKLVGFYAPDQLKGEEEKVSWKN